MDGRRILRWFGFILIAIAVTFVCAVWWQSSTERQLVGKWRLLSNDDRYDMILSDDGQYAIASGMMGRSLYWSVWGEEFIVETAQSPLARIFRPLAPLFGQKPTPVEAYRFEVTESQLSLIEQNGHRHEYRRIADK
jgi:hypothetical protein